MRVEFWERMLSTSLAEVATLASKHSHFRGAKPKRSVQILLSQPHPYSVLLPLRPCTARKGIPYTTGLCAVQQMGPLPPFIVTQVETSLHS